MRIRIAIAVLGLVLAAQASPAEELRVELRPASTTIAFTLKATMHTVHGTATLDRGAFVFDTETGAASGEAVVAAPSAATGNKKRDKKMHNKVLLSAEHPQIRLRAASYEGTLSSEGASEITLVGTLELLGTEHPIRVALVVAIDGETATVESSFSVPYVEWGLDDPSTLVLRVGKEVPVTVRSENAQVN